MYIRVPIKEDTIGVGDLAQWFERLPRKHKALGSVPSSEKKEQKKKKKKKKTQAIQLSHFLVDI